MWSNTKTQAVLFLKKNTYYVIELNHTWESEKLKKEMDSAPLIPKVGIQSLADTVFNKNPPCVGKTSLSMGISARCGDKHL